MCHLLLSTNENVLVNIGTGQIQNSGSKKILGIKIDYKLNFKDTRKHIQKIKRKIKCFDQGLRLLESWKKRLIMNAFFLSQFSCCPLACMSVDY